MTRIIHTAILFSLVAFSTISKASTVSIGKIDPGPHLLGVIQSTPGIHIGVSNGKFGFGASLDVLGGAILSYPIKGVSPGLVAGPFIEVNVMVKEGTTITWGGRAGAGGLTPTFTDGFVPHALATFDLGRSTGANKGTRMGGHLRGLYGGVGVSKHKEGEFAGTLGIEIPLVPLPLLY